MELWTNFAKGESELKTSNGIVWEKFAKETEKYMIFTTPKSYMSEDHFR